MNGWTGDISATFQLIAAGNVIQTMAANGSTAGEVGLPVVVSVNATIPATDYVGPAELLVTSVATPSAGGEPVTLTSSAVLEVGTSGIRRLVQVFALVNAVDSLFPCTRRGPPACPLGLPPDTVIVAPVNFLSPSTQGFAFTLFQSDGFTGDVRCTYDIIESGKIVETVTSRSNVDGAGMWIQGSGWQPSPRDYVGAATMRVTTLAVADGANNPFTLKSCSAIEMVQ
jgi:hypothetical protein